MNYVLLLPYPVSVNCYKAPRIVKPKGGKPFITWYLTDEAKAYKEEVAWRARAAGFHQPLQGRIAVHMALYPKRPQDAERRIRKNPHNWDDDVQSLDLDNARKVILDALNGVAYIDDRWIWSDSAERMEPDGEARVVVTIAPIVRPSPQLELALELERTERASGVPF